MISVRGKIVAPDGEDKNRREILVEEKSEYDKLPRDKYPVTHDIKPEGVAAILVNGDNECEVSFHRYENGFFYIGSANRRLGLRDCTEMFRKFREDVGITEGGTLVKLEFDGYKIKISKV